MGKRCRKDSFHGKWTNKLKIKTYLIRGKVISFNSWIHKVVCCKKNMLGSLLVITLEGKRWGNKHQGAEKLNIAPFWELNCVSVGQTQSVPPFELNSFLECTMADRLNTSLKDRYMTSSPNSRKAVGSHILTIIFSTAQIWVTFLRPLHAVQLLNRLWGIQCHKTFQSCYLINMQCDEVAFVET